MSTPAPPARLWVLIPSEGVLSTIVRRGPSHWSHLTTWNMDTDQFTPGQWLRGKLAHASLSPNGKHLTIAVMGGRTRVGSWEDTQYVSVSRTPYFTSLAIAFGGLCYTTGLFTVDGHLVMPFGNRTEWRAPSKCPYRQGTLEPRWYEKPLEPNECSMSHPVSQWTTPNGRSLFAKEGVLYENLSSGSKLLFDANLLRPEPIETPEWAKDW